MIFELDPRADGVEVILDHRHAFPEADDVVVAGQEVETLVIHLAEKQEWLKVKGVCCQSSGYFKIAKDLFSACHLK